MWQKVDLTSVSRSNPTILPWTWSPAVVGHPHVAEITLFMDLTHMLFFSLKILFIHQRQREREREREREGQRHRQREKQTPCREPDVGQDPWSPGSHPRLQAAPNRCATGAAPVYHILFIQLSVGVF